MARILIPKQSRLTKKGNIISVVVCDVQKSKDYPEGINYSFQLIHKNKRVLGYDNNTNEGHHRHYLDDNKLAREEIKFKDLKTVYERFLKEVKEFEGDEK